MAKIIQTQSQDGQRFGLFGASGSGKSYRAREIIKNSNRLIVFDSVKNEWAQHAKDWLGRSAIICYSLAELKQSLVKRWRKGFKIVFVPPFGREIVALHEVSSIIWQVQAGYGKDHLAKITFFVDEAQEGAPAGLKQRYPAHGALRLAVMGRGRGINFLFASQRLKSVDVNLRANLTGLYIFRLSDLADVQEARRLLMGKNAGEIPNYAYFYKDENGKITFFEKR